MLLFLPLLISCGPKAAKPELPEAAPTNAAQSPGTLRLSKESKEAAGLELAKVEARDQTQLIKTTGEIKADESKVFHINSIVSGRVVQDNVQLGQLLKVGQVLAVVQNLELAKVYGDYIHKAHQNEIEIKSNQEKLDLYKKNLERASKLFQEGIGAQKDMLQAQNQVNLTEIELKGLKEHAEHLESEAEAMLSAYGVSLDKAATLKIETGSPLKTPRGGVVIQKSITVGDVVTAEQPLYVVADLSTIWLDIAVYDKDFDNLSLGQSVSFRTDSLPSKVFQGKIDYIPPSASHLRTFTARSVLPNPGLQLKPGMFCQVSIEKKSKLELPYLPDSAIQKYGKEHFAFVELADGSFQKRVLELSDRIGDGYLLSSGVKIGETVVTQGSFFLKSELLKSESKQED